MNERPYEVAYLDELDRFPVDDEGLVWRPVRRRLGIQAFGTNAYTAEKAGDRVVEEHGEQDGDEELYLVAAGRATFVLDEEEIDAAAGTVVFASPGTTRGAVAAEPGTTVVAFGAKPGVANEVSEWENIFLAFGYWRNGDEAKGREAMADAIAQSPEAWQGHYNAACFESLTKNRESAFEHLSRAIELEPKAREYAETDKDFDWLRDDPAFPA